MKYMPDLNESSAFNVQKNRFHQARNARRDSILEKAKEFCGRHGFADLGDGFVIVDTAKFEVRSK